MSKLSVATDSDADGAAVSKEGGAAGRQLLGLVFALLFTLGFIAVEIHYNFNLLSSLSDPNTTQQHIDRLSNEGKLLAAFGITWAVFRFPLAKVPLIWLRAVAFIAIAVMLYWAIGALYTKAIAGLDPRVKVDGFHLFAYRADLLTGKLEDPDIPLPKNDRVLGSILMTSLPIVMFDDRYMIPARDILERKAGDRVRFVMERAEQGWPRYSRQMEALRQAHNEFVVNSRKAIQYRAFGGIEKFRNGSGGLDPDPGISRVEFIRVLRASNHPKGRELRESEAQEVGRRADGSPLRAHELPYFMDRATYFAWFEREAAQARLKLVPTEQTVEHFAGINDINSAVFIPPMSVITSFVSVLTNAASALLLVLSILAALVGGAASRTLQNVLSLASVPFVCAFVALVVSTADKTVFPDVSPMGRLEQRMQAEYGIAGHAWSRLSSIQARVLRIVM